MTRNGHTKDKILYHAMVLFGEKGYERVSMRQIAGAVGIKESSIYNHFEGKEEILEHIMTYFENRIHHYRPSISQIDKMLATESPEAVLRKFIITFDEKEYSYMLSMYRILFMEQYRNEELRGIFLEQAVNKPVAHLRHTIDYMASKGQIPPCDSETIARLWAGSVLVVAMEATHGLPREDVISHHMKIGNLCIAMILGKENHASASA